ncbi:threonylcarbamoyl-AMP synthase [Tistrella bauzanensis]|uniref:Threonylcarbamoyl-AMP synthase n=1 Tax=Tistrella bauzanensis TaxID=657419 RepID=A0ABQ1ISV8_9PROT|nr:L-threonylcarbamoyladenylate synthase [Tistrella bauzanensis]GGB51640.1 threonylcarbamoyl-AMP synthase [Tistrella bauzanensis]
MTNHTEDPASAGTTASAVGDAARTVPATRRLRVAAHGTGDDDTAIVDQAPIDQVTIDQAASLLRSGALVAFPTETVYGLGADATSDAAVAAVYAAKGRPSRNPLIVHAADADAALALVRADERAVRLAAAFWPGPLTMVMPRRPDCPIADAATAGGPTLAVRVPALTVARRLIRAAGRPLVGPSANRSGHVSPTTADHVLADLDGRIAAVLDAGPCRVGVESTVIDLSGPLLRVLRPGAVTLSMLRRVIGADAVDGAPAIDGGRDDGHTALPSPGMLGSHYAPRRQVRLNAAAPLPGHREVLLAFGPPPAGFAAVLPLSVNADPVEAARRLYARLREADALDDIDGIAVAPLDRRPAAAGNADAADLLGALGDRLGRAAAPRPQASMPAGPQAGLAGETPRDRHHTDIKPA